VTGAISLSAAGALSVTRKTAGKTAFLADAPVHELAEKKSKDAGEKA
jgi:hypothetical protein